MEQQVEGNKLIAEFMGGKSEYDAPIGWIKNVSGLPTDEQPNDRFHLEQGKYHSSWDWLMPVVEKIENNYEAVFHISGNLVAVISNDGKNYEWNGGRTNDNKIISVWYAVVEFIKWYNQNKK